MLFIILTLIVGNKYVNKIVEDKVDFELEDEESEEEGVGEEGEEGVGEEGEEGVEEGIEEVEDGDEDEVQREESNNDLQITESNQYNEEVKEVDNYYVIQILQKIKILITYLQINSILSVNLNIKWPKFMKSVMTAFKSINLEVFDFVGLDYRCQVKFDFYHIFIFKMFMLPIIFTLTLLSYGIVWWWGKTKNKKSIFFEVITNRLIYTLVLITFMLYPGVCNTILQIFKCEEIENNWYLSEDLSLKCYDNMWNSYAITSSFFIFIYILGIPLYFYLKLRYYKKRCMLSHKEIIYKYGFLYLGYLPHMWWFEILELMRKTILSASIIYLDESATRIIVAMIVCGIYLLYIAYNQPQSKPENTFLSVLSATELFLLLFCGLILEVKIDIKDKYNQAAFDGVMFVIFTILLFIGHYQIIKELRENGVYTIIRNKYLIMKRRLIKYYNKLKWCKKKEEYQLEEIKNEIKIVLRETSV